MNDTVIGNSVIVKSGDVVHHRGIFKYHEHVNKNEDISCTPSEKEKNGRVLSEGIEAPKLGCCPHEVKWILKKELKI